MNEFIGKAILIVAALVLETLPADAQLCDLARTLSQMDTASAQFKSAQADFTWDQYEVVVQDHEKQTGTVYFLRHGFVTTAAMDIQTPATKKVVYDGNEVSIYTPGTNDELIYSVAKNRELAEEFLTLGFGGSGTDLKKNWDVTCAGTETIAGTQTAKLVLVAKLDSVRNNFSKVTIWVDPTRAISLKQLFEQPSGDTRTNTFTNIKYNAPVSANEFKIKTAPGATITRK